MMTAVCLSACEHIMRFQFIAVYLHFSVFLSADFVFLQPYFSGSLGCMYVKHEISDPLFFLPVVLSGLQ